MGRHKHVVVSVNAHNIRYNIRHEDKRPPLRIEMPTGEVEYAFETVIYDLDHNEIARLVYRPDEPLSCGARLWLELCGGASMRLPSIPIDHLGVPKKERRS